eukprot:CAMPEP_0177385284 /NCGR_PEP_ID=MMETSP0368-20130122/50155_1 /TAXON_ID=447022 ORGANISM="Scrippsiella hangoei-like, Strain SHHI-4" /NCGR_SAMPLE_ID=MMETSP0368 /ASSEMBLY_ACC=CAM_ASM_000363 /LENGTH=59 /DNA_ID=CAMNT_0018850029 /DNA_START=330 /DNA_END=505 /DNA_ORIENTATION=+
MLCPTRRRAPAPATTLAAWMSTEVTDGSRERGGDSASGEVAMAAPGGAHQGSKLRGGKP